MYQVGLRSGPSSWAEAYDRVLEQLSGGVSVLVVHLGQDDPELRRITHGVWPWGARWRSLDLDYVGSAYFKAKLASERISLTSWRRFLSKADVRRPACDVVAQCERFDARERFSGGLEYLGDGEGTDWTRRPTTLDQLNIERTLLGTELTGKRLLHVGIGNSSFASRFAHSVERIDGVTVSQAEYELAQGLKIPNYVVHVRDKYQPGLARHLDSTYDIIIDNNIGSFACCAGHVRSMLGEFSSLLRQNGCVLTDQNGMDWKVSRGGIRLSVRHLVRLCAGHGLEVVRLGGGVYALMKGDSPMWNVDGPMS
jgi:hypothetical protein